MSWERLSDVPVELRGLGVEGARFWEAARVAAEGHGLEPDEARALAWKAVNGRPGLELLAELAEAPPHARLAAAQVIHGRIMREVVIRAEPPIFTATVDSLGDALARSFGTIATEKVTAAAQAIGEISELPIPSAERWAKAKGVVEALEADLATVGENLTSDHKVEIGRYLAVAYRLGKAEMMTPLGWKAGFELADQDGIAGLQNAGIFWVGKHYGEALDTEGALAAVRQTMLIDGLGRREGGRALAKHWGGQIQRSDVYWRGLAATMATRSRSFGAIAGMEAAGAVRYEYVNPMDERTSDVCAHLSGTMFTIKGAVKLRDQLLQAKDPEEWKAISPWPKIGDLFDAEGKPLKPGKLQAKGIAFPPLHFHCRSSVVVRVWQPLGGGEPDPYGGVDPNVPPEEPPPAPPAPFPDPPPVVAPRWAPNIPKIGSELLTDDPSYDDWIAVFRLNGYTAEEIEALLAAELPAALKGVVEFDTLAAAIKADDALDVMAWMEAAPPANPATITEALIPPKAWGKLRDAHLKGAPAGGSFADVSKWLEGLGYEKAEISNLLIEGPGGTLITGATLNPGWSPAQLALYLHEHPPAGVVPGWPPALLPSEWFALAGKKGPGLDEAVGAWLKGRGYGVSQEAVDVAKGEILKALGKVSDTAAAAAADVRIKAFLAAFPPGVVPKGPGLAGGLTWPPREFPPWWFNGAKVEAEDVWWWARAWGYDLGSDAPQFKTLASSLNTFNTAKMPIPDREKLLAEILGSDATWPKPKGWDPSVLLWDPDYSEIDESIADVLGYTSKGIALANDAVNDAVMRSIKADVINSLDPDWMKPGSKSLAVVHDTLKGYAPPNIKTSMPWHPGALPDGASGWSLGAWEDFARAQGYGSGEMIDIGEGLHGLAATKAANLQEAATAFLKGHPPKVMIGKGAWAPALPAEHPILDQALGAAAWEAEAAAWLEAQGYHGSQIAEAAAKVKEALAAAWATPGESAGAPLVAQVLKGYPPDLANPIKAFALPKGPATVSPAQLWQPGAPDATVALEDKLTPWKGWLKGEGYSKEEIDALLPLKEWNAAKKWTPPDWPPSEATLYKAATHDEISDWLGFVVTDSIEEAAAKIPKGLKLTQAEALKVAGQMADSDFENIMGDLAKALAEHAQVKPWAGAPQPPGLAGVIWKGKGSAHPSQLAKAQDIGGDVLEALKDKPPGKVIQVKVAPVSFLDPDEYGARLSSATGSLSNSPPVKEMGDAYQDTLTGSRVWVRKPTVEEDAGHQAIASAFYRDLGIDVPKVRVARLDGKLAAVQDDVSGWSPKAFGTWDAVDARKIAAEMPADAFLGNWNVTGTSKDRILWRANPPAEGSRLLRSVNDGVLKYRSTGSTKGAAWGAKVTEMDTFLDANGVASNAAALFSEAANDRSLLLPMMDKIAEMDDARLAELVRVGNLRQAEADELLGVLKGRRDDMKARAKALRRDLKEEAEAARLAAEQAARQAVEAEKLRAEMAKRLKEALEKGEALPPGGRAPLLDLEAAFPTLETRGAVSVEGDSRTVRNHQIRIERYQLRKGKAIEENGYQVEMEVDQAQWATVEAAIRRSYAGKPGGWRSWTRYGFGTKADTSASPVLQLDAAKPSDFLGASIIGQRGPIRVDFGGASAKKAMQGSIRIMINEADPAAAQALLEQGLRDLGLDAALMPTTEEAKVLMLANRVQWQAAGAKHVEIRTAAQARQYLSDQGVDLSAVRFEATDRGHVEIFVAGRDAEFRQKGGTLLYHGFNDRGPAFNSLLGLDGGKGGIIATRERTNAGVVVGGMSSSTDLDTGGAQSVFLRAGGKKGGAATFNGWGDYQIVLDPDILNRLDWYGYNGDNFGRTTGYAWDTRPSATQWIGQVTGSSSMQSNEVMLRNAVDLKHIMFVRCSSDSGRQAAIAKARAAGATEINGVPVDDFFVVMRTPTDFSKLKASVPNHATILKGAK